MRKLENMQVLTWHSHKKKKVIIGHEKDTYLNKKKKLIAKETPDVCGKP